MPLRVDGTDTLVKRSGVEHLGAANSAWDAQRQVQVPVVRRALFSKSRGVRYSTLEQAGVDATHLKPRYWQNLFRERFAESLGGFVMGALPDPNYLLPAEITETKPSVEWARPLEIVRRGGFTRVPTHAIGVVQERRSHPRAGLHLPMRLMAIAGRREPQPVTLVTQNISSSGIYFLCPLPIEPGTAIDLEVGLVERPLGHGSVRMVTAAHVVRTDRAETPGWRGVAATFDDIDFHRDERMIPRSEEF